MIHSSLSRRALLALTGVAALTLAGCGRKADPKRPLDADPKAPRTYPVDRNAPSEQPAEPREQEQSPFLTPPAIQPGPLGPLPPSPVFR